MEAVKNIWNGLDWSVLTDMLLSCLPALICITFHELAHGYIAWFLGDNTAKQMGRLTLNPIKHIDPMGLVAMLLFHFGWAKPVPVDMRNFKNPKSGMAVTALAGPLANVLITVIALFIYGLCYRVAGELVLKMIYLTAYTSIYFAIFNLMPIPPLDGSKIVFSFLSDEMYNKLMRYEKYGMIILVVLVAADVLPLGKIAGLVFDKLFPIAEFAYGLTV